MLTLAIGDLYIPDRSIELPARFQKLLAPNPQNVPSNSKISQVLCLGNITNSNEILKFLHDLSPSLHLVKGEFDDCNVISQQLNQLNEEKFGKDQEKVGDLPSYKIIIHDNLRIGMTNGFQVVPKNDPLSLLALARELDVDILIWGGTHKVEAYILDGKFFINPGSGTGAYNFDWPNDEEESEEEDDEEKEDEVEKEEEKEEKEENEEKEEKKQETEEKKEETEEPQLEDQGEEQKEEETEKEEQKEEEQKEEEQKEGDEITSTDLEELEELTTNIPSFCLLETHNSSCTLYIYTYLGEEVKVDKVTYHKD